MMNTLLIMAAVVCFTLASALSEAIPVRLVEGLDQYSGRVEVYYNGTWGTVCKDAWNDVECTVVCNQLNFSGGQHDKDIIRPGVDPIWLDNVKCVGDERHLGECQHNHWGEHNCVHNEDTYCVCDPPATNTGNCSSHRHRISYFDPLYPGIGRVEVQDDTGTWHGVCDDHWDSVDATVFCQCLGFTRVSDFQAIWSKELLSLPPISIAFDALHCDNSDVTASHNLWECPSVLANGTCDPSREAAAVACEPLPRHQPPAAPTVHLMCSADTLSMCFDSEDYSLDARYLSLTSVCDNPTATSTTNITDGVCLHVQMEHCDPVESTTDSSFKHYCYDILYSQYDSDPDTLLVDPIWSRRACCSIDKNGTVQGEFRPSVPNQNQAVYAQAPTDFSMACYANDTFSGTPLSAADSILRGEDVYCKVMTNTWDKQMYLVVPRCTFSAFSSGSTAFVFHEDKCPTTATLDLSYFSFDDHNWGFKFMMPKFQGHDSLYVTCDTYICDSVKDSKPYCDRTCEQSARRKRRATASSYGTGIAYEKVSLGPLSVKDEGSGPLITKDGRYIVVKVGQDTLNEWYEEKTASNPLTKGNVDIPLFSNTLVAATQSVHIKWLPTVFFICLISIVHMLLFT